MGLFNIMGRNRDRQNRYRSNVTMTTANNDKTNDNKADNKTVAIIKADPGKKPVVTYSYSPPPISPNKGKAESVFDRDAFKKICEMDELDFVEYAEKYELDDGRYFFFKNNGSKVLAVAHLDNVQSDRSTSIMDTADGPVIFSGALDDRLGAAIILDMLPKLGINVDILLTTDEEKGRSTADAFYIDKKYNHIIEFDRKGTDVVMYNYETPEYRKMLRDLGITVGIGSFSDIACLEHLKTFAANWGCGYADYHSIRSHAWLKDTFKMVDLYLDFHEVYGNEHLPHVEKPRYSYTVVNGGANWKNGEYNSSKKKDKKPAAKTYDTFYTEKWEQLLQEDGDWTKQYGAEMDALEKAAEEDEHKSIAAEVDSWNEAEVTIDMVKCPVCEAELADGICEECGENWWQLASEIIRIRVEQAEHDAHLKDIKEQTA